MIGLWWLPRCLPLGLLWLLAWRTSMDWDIIPGNNPRAHMFLT
ncbi:hypothetical protein FOTG_18349 [Fusarium oxysporum f. sp. vasinfectum 25433]|uniref:Uncharacterized protein n=1 Tax=Fusarium oxysporum f. sp. vasinfectum 25433 TaxID=1089449 RepID=X0KWY9_FUSOX|nr:hypothetical protein FOTG_18349 [Fusarium oxysporum f. sp. vasinfectum 25433]